MAYFTASCDPVEKNTRFAQSLELDYPILSDPEKNVARAYGVVTDERKNPFRWTFYIDVDGRIMLVDKKIHTKTAGADVAATLKKLGVRQKPKRHKKK